MVQCITRVPDIDIFRALLAKDRIDNVCGLANNVVFYVILFTGVVFELVRRYDVRADCTVFPARLTSISSSDTFLPRQTHNTRFLCTGSEKVT